MSQKHPVVVITGSSGAGTTSVSHAMEQIFRREHMTPVMVEGDSFHRYDRVDMAAKIATAEADGNHNFCHFSPEANLMTDLEQLFLNYGQTGTGRIRRYLHDADEAATYGQPAGTFTEWSDIPEGTDLLFYEGLHGAIVTTEVNIAKYADLKIGVVPIINLEWIQKLHRDRDARGYSDEAVVHTILRRMPDYVNYICPQFSETDVNFQRVPTVDTSNPFVARYIPSADESFLVIRFRDPRGIDFSYLLAMLHDSFMSRKNTIVVPGGKMDLAMQLIFTPLLQRLMERRKFPSGEGWQALRA